MLEKSSELINSHLSSTKWESSPSTLSWWSFRWNIWKLWRNSIKQIFDSSFIIVEGGSESSNTLLSSESHVYKFCDLCLMFSVLCWLRLFLLLFLFLFFFFLFLLFFGCFWLTLFLGLGCRFGNLIHADHKISILDANFLNWVVIIEGFPLENNF